MNGWNNKAKFPCSTPEPHPCMGAVADFSVTHDLQAVGERVDGQRATLALSTLLIQQQVNRHA